jgi:hypothetical protein
MKKVNIILLALIVTAGMSCSGDKNKKQSKKREGSFDKVYSVTGEEILNEEYNIAFFDFVDKYLLANLRNTDDYYFTLYETGTNKKVMGLFPHGKGPGEFSGGFSYQYCEKENGRLYVWILDYQKSLLYKTDITKSVEENKTVVDKVIKVGTKEGFYVDMDFYSVFYIDSTKLVGSTSNMSLKMKRFVIYNPVEGKFVKTVPLFPKVENNNDDVGFIWYRYNFLYLAGFKMKPDKTKFASAMSMFNRVDIFDVDGNVLNSYIDKDNITESLIKEFLAVKEENVKKVPVKNYYAGLYVTDSYIYALYHNKLSSDYKTSIPVQIRIFTWDAEPVCTIKVPDYLQYITIDEKNGILYGCAINDEKILKYDIKGIIDKISK